jgi:hypothetical protein
MRPVSTRLRLMTLRTKLDTSHLAQDKALAVEVTDSDYPELLARFAYDWYITSDFVLVSVSVSRASGRARLGFGLTMSQMRDLPLSTWQQAAYAAAVEQILKPLTRATTDAPHTADVATRIITSVPRNPGRLVAVAADYRAKVAAGIRNPSAEIARTYGVKPSTARSWIHRARAVGLLGPAPRNSAGEQP